MPKSGAENLKDDGLPAVLPYLCFPVYRKTGPWGEQGAFRESALLFPGLSTRPKDHAAPSHFTVEAASH